MWRTAILNLIFLYDQDQIIYIVLYNNVLFCLKCDERPFWIWFFYVTKAKLLILWRSDPYANVVLHVTRCSCIVPVIVCYTVDLIWPVITGDNLLYRFTLFSSFEVMKHIFSVFPKVAVRSIDLPWIRKCVDIAS